MGFYQNHIQGHYMCNAFYYVKSFLLYTKIKKLVKNIHNSYNFLTLSLFKIN